MKLRVYFNPGPVVMGLAVTAMLCCLAALLSTGIWSLSWSAAASFYTGIAILSCFALVRCRALESREFWKKAERLLILAPHQDDCVICAGGIGILNKKLGGETRVVYFVQDDKPGMAEVRKTEAIAAWSLAGVSPDCLIHLDLLPPLYGRDPIRLNAATTELKQIIDGFSPTVVVMPMFEGGHIHHDLLNHLATLVLVSSETQLVFESPEYSPYVSLRFTPHRVISLCGRWLFGLVSYYGPPDGVDSRPVRIVPLETHELKLKGAMLAAFASQNGESLALTHCYPDRLVRWHSRPYKSRPFEITGSYLRMVQGLSRWLPLKWVGLLFPVQMGTVGREPDITDLDREWASSETICIHE